MKELRLRACDMGYVEIKKNCAFDGLCGKLIKLFLTGHETNIKCNLKELRLRASDLLLTTERIALS